MNKIISANLLSLSILLWLENVRDPRHLVHDSLRFPLRQCGLHALGKLSMVDFHIKLAVLWVRRELTPEKKPQNINGFIFIMQPSQTECSHYLRLISIGHQNVIFFYTYLTSLILEVLPMCLAVAMAKGLEVRLTLDLSMNYLCEKNQRPWSVTICLLISVRKWKNEAVARSRRLHRLSGFTPWEASEQDTTHRSERIIIS